MRRMMLAAACCLAPVVAHAQPAQKPEMVLLPRALAEAAAQWIATPNAGNAVQIYAGLAACIADNPVNGVVRRTGADQCPAVTQALEAKKPAPPHPAAAAPGTPPPRADRAPAPAARPAHPGSR